MWGKNRRRPAASMARTHADSRRANGVAVPVAHRVRNDSFMLWGLRSHSGSRASHSSTVHLKLIHLTLVDSSTFWLNVNNVST